VIVEDVPPTGVLPKLCELITAFGYPGTRFGFDRPGPVWPTIGVVDAALFGFAGEEEGAAFGACFEKTRICRLNSRRDPPLLIVTTLWSTVETAVCAAGVAGVVAARAMPLTVANKTTPQNNTVPGASIFQ